MLAVKMAPAASLTTGSVTATLTVVTGLTNITATVHTGEMAAVTRPHWTMRLVCYMYTAYGQHGNQTSAGSFDCKTHCESI